MDLIQFITRKVSRKITRENLDSFLKSHATSDKTLDIGSGSSLYANYFPNRLGLDIAKSRNPDLIADAHSLPFRNESFDCILCTEVLEHLKEPHKAKNEMNRVLRDGGKLILTTRFIFPLHDTPDDFYRFTKYGLRYLLRDWDIVKIQEETDTIGSIAVLIQRIAFQCRFFLPRFDLLLHPIAHIIKRFGFIIKKEYGVFYEHIPEEKIMTSGYYVIAVKIGGASQGKPDADK